MVFGNENNQRKIMRNKLQKLIVGVILTVSVTVVSQAKVSQEEYHAKLKLARTAYAVGTLSEKAAKIYMYIGNNVGTRQVKRELGMAKKRYAQMIKVLEESINDDKDKNLLTFIQMSREEMKEILSQPYSLDNAVLMLDLSQTILESSRLIAERLKKSINYSDKYFVNGVRTYFESIPKYYIAYQSGIKDEITIQQMKETVEAANDVIEGLAKSPLNTVAMNQKMGKTKRLWSVVRKFYLDIDKGGLPFVVYKTSLDIIKNLWAYMNMAEEVRKTQAIERTKKNK